MRSKVCDEITYLVFWEKNTYQEKKQGYVLWQPSEYWNHYKNVSRYTGHLGTELYIPIISNILSVLL